MNHCVRGGFLSSAEVLTAMPKKAVRVLNFGSLNIDFVYTMDHFVRPGETESSLSLQRFAGGKGLNQSVALANALTEVYHAGAVGEDGQFLIELLRTRGVDTSHIAVLSERTGHAIIQLERKGQNSIILYGGANQAIPREQVDQTLRQFSSGDILLLQNEINQNEYIMTKAFERGMRIALNPSPINDALKRLPLDRVSYFILNEIEGRELTGQEEPRRIITTMAVKYPGCKVVLTLGKEGAMAYDGKNIYTHGIYDVPVIDTTGAGDTFTGFFLSSVANGLPFDRALEIASKASSLAVTVKGAANSIPTMKKVLESRMKLVE